MDLDHALEAHVAWKVRFRMAILEGRPLDPAGLERDDRCELGRWLLGEGRQRWGGHPAFEACLEEHRNFHHAVSQVALALRAGRMDEASRLMNPTEGFTRSSAALGNALAQLAREVQPGLAASRATPPAATAQPDAQSR